jgi:polyferredoxin
MCVQTCPTGIDIREGLQMECVHCTQCMDACDQVMVQIGRPTGLIRYGTRDGFEGRSSGWWRPRVVLYPVTLAIVLGTLVALLVMRRDTEITMLGGLARPYTLEADGSVMNQLRVKLVNRAGRDRAYWIALDGVPDARLIVPVEPQPVPAGGMATASLIVLSPSGAFHDGERTIRLRIRDGARFDERVSYELPGPRAGEGHADGAREHEEHR